MNKKEEIPERNVWFYCQICHIVPSVQIIYDNNADPLLSITCNCGYKKEQLSKYLSKITLEIIGTKSFDNSQTSTGGIHLSEINPHTMESLKCKNLFITGEILDVDGDCGGYNLAFAWITGMLAGRGTHND